MRTDGGPRFGGQSATAPLRDATLGCNVLAVRPRTVIIADGNPRTAAALVAAGCEVHTYPAVETG